MEKNQATKKVNRKTVLIVTAVAAVAVALILLITQDRKSVV